MSEARNIDMMLDDALRTAIETQDVGKNIIIELEDQRGKINMLNDKTKLINGNISRSGTVLSRMYIANKREQIICSVILLRCLAIIIIIALVMVSR